MQSLKFCFIIFYQAQQLRLNTVNLMVKITVINEEPDGGNVAIVQVGSEVHETLCPGQQITLHITDGAEAVISKETD